MLIVENNYVSSLYIPNLWREFTYDELTINMRQKDDEDFVNMLAEVRMGVVSPYTLNFLQRRLITFNSITIDDRLQELARFILSLPMDTICLLPIKYAASQLNGAVLHLGTCW
jgi:hypothetical protein